MTDHKDNLSDGAIEAAHKIRESLFGLFRIAENENHEMLAYMLRRAIIEANHVIGDNNIVEMKGRKADLT